MSVKSNCFSPITPKEGAVLKKFVGAQLLGVSYHCLKQVDGVAYAGGHSGVDCDMVAVELNLGGHGSMSITWAMCGELEGLAVISGTYSSSVENEIVDASSRDAWREHVGGVIESVAAAWHVSGDGCPESLWAVRMQFAESSVVVALGHGPELSYMPNEIVVVFDMSLARSYKPSHAADSCWGRSMET